jgi:hypothetical protein
MVAPSIGSVVLVRFPFSDLSESKLRPAVVLADAGRGDWVLCQVTSNPYSDSRAVELFSIPILHPGVLPASVTPGQGNSSPPIRCSCNEQWGNCHRKKWRLY